MLLLQAAGVFQSLAHLSIHSRSRIAPSTNQDVDFALVVFSEELVSPLFIYSIVGGKTENNYYYVIIA